MLKQALMGAALCLPLAAFAGPGDWPSYGHDAGGGRFSPLAQITPENVDRLQPAWTYHMNPTPGATAAAATTTPLVADGLLYLGTPYGRVVALDATTGSQVWAYQLPAGDQPANRGIGYWPGDKAHAPRIVFGSTGGRLIALDAGTGEPAKGFGENGVVDTKTPDILNGVPNAYYGYSAPPAIYRNLAIMGSRVQENPSKGASGDVRAWDIVTGKPAWRFHSIPRPGEKFHDTWDGDSWKQRSGVNVWNMMTVDAARGIAYLPFGAPTFDRYGGDHKGLNLFASSLVAVDAATGRYLWHFQVTHHDIWDFDLDTPPVLLEVKKDGKTIPGIAVMSKTAILFLLDRVTGKPIYDVKEMPVPTDTDIPDEKPSPTQPFSVTPPLGKLSWEANDISNVTPEHRAYCEKFIADNKGVAAKPFQPLRVDSSPVSFPGSLGGADWGGGSFDPKNGIFVINTNNLAHFTQQVKQPDGSYGMLHSYQYFWDPRTRMPCQGGVWGQLTGVDVNTGQIKWQVPLGISENLPAGQQNTGRVNLGNPMLTAGGLTFIGATDDLRFRAFDTRTGKEVWTVKIPGSASTGPVTYRGRDGRQYVAVVATGGNNAGAPVMSDQIIAYALPKK